MLNMEIDEAVGLSDIIEILNTLDNQSPDLNNTLAQLEVATPFATYQPTNLPASSATAPTTVRATVQSLSSNVPSTIQSTQNVASSRSSQKPFINIIEQPAGKALRFRYECEGRSAGSIPGVNSTPENKTYPTIEIVGYTGEVIVVVSCVTKDPPHRPHPHKLVGKDGCKNGVCRINLNGDSLRAVFSNLGIQCVKKKDVRVELEQREKLKVDPFRTGFDHKDQPSSIDLNAVRLAFQAFQKTTSGGYKPLKAVVSDPIYDKKAMSDLVICRLCSCAANVNGGTEIILLCEKIVRDDIKIRFFELNADDQIVWEDYAQFHQSDIHKQTAITFKTPRYHKTDITESAKVFIQLYRPSDKATSEALPFEFFPDQDQIKRKRLRDNGSTLNRLKMELQQPKGQFQNDLSNISAPWITPIMPEIKAEPAVSPQQFNTYRSPYHMSPSPQPLSPMTRNDTPSPALLKPINIGTNGTKATNATANTTNTQIPMMDMFTFTATTTSNTNTFGTNTKATQQFSGNPFMGNETICDNNLSVPASINMLFNNSSNNNNNANTNANSNPFVDHFAIAPTTSGGSFTPINEESRPFLNMNIIDPIPVKDQHVLQFQNDIGALMNENVEEGPTLSGLLALVDSEQLLNINSDELALSNLSITT